MQSDTDMVNMPFLVTWIENFPYIAESGHFIAL